MPRSFINKHPKLAERLLEAQQRRCYLCCGLFAPADMQAFIHDGDRISIDHVIPLSRGGTDSERNKALAHRRCNEIKADRFPYACEQLYVDNLLYPAAAMTQPERRGGFDDLLKQAMEAA